MMTGWIVSFALYVIGAVAFLILEDWSGRHTGSKAAFCLAWPVTAPVAIAVGLITAFLDMAQQDSD